MSNGWIRTSYTSINSRVLYLMSYICNWHLKPTPLCIAALAYGAGSAARTGGGIKTSAR